MRLIALAPFLLLAAAQQQQPSQSANVHVTQTVIESVGLGPNRQATTFVSTQVITITDEPPQPTPSGSGAANPSGGSANNTLSQSQTSSQRPLPTAPSDVPGGGGPNGAPVVGQDSPGGIYGPPDGYTAGALSIKIPYQAVTILGMLLGGAFVLL